MNITLYQIIVPLFSVIAILYGWNLVWRRKKSAWQATIWTCIWGFIAAIAMFPNLLSYISLFTGVKDRANAVFVTSFGVLFLIVFYLVQRLESLQQEHHKFIRKLAVEDFKKEYITKQ
jgi:hypothetical protein